MFSYIIFNYQNNHPKCSRKYKTCTQQFGLLCEICHNEVQRLCFEFSVRLYILNTKGLVVKEFFYDPNIFVWLLSYMEFVEVRLILVTVLLCNEVIFDDSSSRCICVSLQNRVVLLLF